MSDFFVFMLSGLFLASLIAIATFLYNSGKINDSGKKYKKRGRFGKHNNSNNLIEGRYYFSNDGFLVDVNTKLQWAIPGWSIARGELPSDINSPGRGQFVKYTWQDAAYKSSRIISNDWRMPTIGELRSLNVPAFKNAFPAKFYTDETSKYCSYQKMNSHKTSPHGIPYGYYWSRDETAARNFQYSIIHLSGGYESSASNRDGIFHILICVRNL